MLNPPDTRKSLRNLACVTDDEVRRLVLLALCKSSDLYPLPTSLVKDYCLHFLTPIINLVKDYCLHLLTTIINLSLSERLFPEYFKYALY